MLGANGEPDRQALCSGEAHLSHGEDRHKLEQTDIMIELQMVKGLRKKHDGVTEKSGVPTSDWGSQWHVGTGSHGSHRLVRADPVLFFPTVHG